MPVLVTGGAGYIGSVTTADLLNNGERVVVLDDLSNGHRAAVPNGAAFYEGKTSDTALIERIIKEHGITQVVHFAGFISVPESVEKPYDYFKVNTTDTLELLNALVRGGVSNFVFSSTAAVYGEPQCTPIDEEHPKNPTNPYGLSKLFVEGILKSFDRAYGLKSVSLRYFNACGGTPERGEAHRAEGHLIPLILEVPMGKRSSVKIFGTDYDTPDGTCIRDYVHISDLSSAHLLALKHLLRGGESLCANLGNGRGFSIMEVIDVAKKVTGFDIPVEKAPRRAGDPSVLVASSQRAREVLGWQPRFEKLEEIVESAWEWHKNHPNGYGK